MLAADFAIVFARRNIAHVHILITGCQSELLVFIRLKEGMFLAQCSMWLKKLCPQCSAVCK